MQVVVIGQLHYVGFQMFKHRSIIFFFSCVWNYVREECQIKELLGLYLRIYPQGLGDQPQRFDFVHFGEVLVVLDDEFDNLDPRGECLWSLEHLLNKLLSKCHVLVHQFKLLEVLQYLALLVTLQVFLHLVQGTLDGLLLVRPRNVIRHLLPHIAHIWYHRVSEFLAWGSGKRILYVRFLWFLIWNDISFSQLFLDPLFDGTLQHPFSNLEGRVVRPICRVQLRSLIRFNPGSHFNRFVSHLLNLLLDGIRLRSYSIQPLLLLLFEGLKYFIKIASVFLSNKLFLDFLKLSHFPPLHLLEPFESFRRELHWRIWLLGSRYHILSCLNRGHWLWLRIDVLHELFIPSLALLDFLLLLQVLFTDLPHLLLYVQLIICLCLSQIHISG